MLEAGHRVEGDEAEQRPLVLRDEDPRVLRREAGEPLDDVARAGRVALVGEQGGDRLGVVLGAGRMVTVGVGHGGDGSGRHEEPMGAAARSAEHERFRAERAGAAARRRWPRPASRVRRARSPPSPRRVGPARPPAGPRCRARAATIQDAVDRPPGRTTGSARRGATDDAAPARTSAPGREQVGELARRPGRARPSPSRRPARASAAASPDQHHVRPRIAAQLEPEAARTARWPAGCRRRRRGGPTRCRPRSRRSARRPSRCRPSPSPRAATVVPIDDR